MAVKKAKIIEKEETGSKLEKDLAELEKKYGLKSIRKGELETTPSGSYTIDKATGIGGYPNGKLVEIYGMESVGKSTIVLHAIASYQKHHPKKRVALMDYEFSYDLIYSKALGIDNDKLLLYQPSSQEEGFNMICDLVEKEIVSLVVIDSHTAATPKKIIEGEMGDATMAVQARGNSKFLAKIKGLLERTGTTLIGVSQTRVNIGGYGELNIPTGGSAWKFYTDMRFKVWKQLDKDNESNRTTLDVVKNKCASPYGKAEFDILWAKGVDNYIEILEMAIEKGVIKRAGAWYSHKEQNIGQGKEAVKQLFIDNPELFEEIKDLTLKD